MAPFQPPCFLFVVLLIWFSCSTPTQEPINQTLLINNSAYNFPTLGLTNLGQDPSGKQYQGYFKILLLLSKGISLRQNEGGDLYLKGKGVLMGLLLYDLAESGLSTGDYFIDLRPPHKIGEASIGFYSLNFDENLVQGPYLDYPGLALLAGKIKVENLLGQTQLTLDLVDENGNTVAGTVQQSLTPFSYTLPF